ncbi:Rhs element Vgr protein [Burkholderia lata]|uniref:Rhs element Vgr protein n=1 Tax=Burkholderia lata (strain ATCC 17760 / DSM 23089 / LMG 22485 / NCIMB 9086 / R18194 / 383) TaxID=482957 RepID=A0A6P2SVT1_BURL3|nr:type VI secretion system tip protein TssI/VgrG [Burkholderia lata]VWC49499.1 Rhs element Vgr protein [Burkholderia lata]
MSRSPLSGADSRLLFIGVPFESFLVVTLEGREAVSDGVELRVHVTGDAVPVALASLIGKQATLSLAWGDAPRQINAVCTRAAQLPSTGEGCHYELELRSWPWLLRLASSNWIFQGKTTQQIVEAVFNKHGATDYSFSLTGHYAPREYCVQYAETDFAFVCRLFEEEGWFYYFRHENGKHTMTIADSNDGFSSLPGITQIEYIHGRSGRIETGRILYCKLVRQTTTAAWTSSDFAYLTPASQLFSQARASADGPVLYEYPGCYQTSAAGSTVAKRRIDELQADAFRLSGDSDCRVLTPGYRFTLSGHESDDANIEWVVLDVTHEATHDAYLNRFDAIPGDTPFRGARKTRRQFMPTQTATVVGKGGEAMWTDKYGRVKVQFHWDRDGQFDENSSCWIRVAQSWAGKSFGAQFMPRVGDEVVVTFINGDPDRPLITGSVYNGVNLPPYALPDNQTQSGIKTRTSEGGAGFNELRFEDRKDNEEVFLQAQKDLKVNVLNDAAWTIDHDETSTIGNARTHTVKQGDDMLFVEQGNRSSTVKTGNETVEIAGTRTVKAGGNEQREVGGNFEQTVSGDYTLTVDGNLTIKVMGTLTLHSTGDLNAKTDGSMTHQAALSLVNKAGASLTNKSDGALSNEGLSVSNKGSAEQTVDGGALLTVKGGIIKMN